MIEPRWVELRNLPDGVKAGNRRAIAKWLAERGRERNVETMVWIDLNETPVRVRAGTSLEADRITVPDELLKRFNDPRERLELWHNHPEAGGVSTAVPGAHDVATTMRRGVVAVGTVDNGEHYIVIRKGEKATENRAAARRWIGIARAAEKWILDQEAWDATDPEGAAYRDINAVETAVAAASAAGLIQARGLSERATLRGAHLARQMEQDGITIENVAAATPQEPEDGTTLKKAQGPARKRGRTRDGQER